MKYNDIEEAYTIKKEIGDIEKAIPFIANSESPAIPFPSNLICGILSDRKAMLINRLADLGVSMGDSLDNKPLLKKILAETAPDPKEFPNIIGQHLDKEV